MRNAADPWQSKDSIHPIVQGQHLRIDSVGPVYGWPSSVATPELVCGSLPRARHCDAETTACSFVAVLSQLPAR
jgi:hypothetical protein